MGAQPQQDSSNMVISASWGEDFARVGTDQRNHEVCLGEQMLGHDIHKPLLPKSWRGDALRGVGGVVWGVFV